MLRRPRTRRCASGSTASRRGGALAPYTRCGARPRGAPAWSSRAARRCSYGAGLRFEGVHWLGPVVGFRVAAEGAWSWNVEEFPAPHRVWRFRRYGVELQVRFGRALGVVRPCVDAGEVLGSGSHFRARPALVAAAEPVFDAGYPAVDELSRGRSGVPPASPARSARVWTSGGGTASGSPSGGHGPGSARASAVGTRSARASRGRSGRSSGSEAGARPVALVGLGLAA